MSIPIGVLKEVTVVYSHANCPDGLASAMILKDAFRMLGTSPRIEFLTHGTPEHKAAGTGREEGVGHEFPLFCDIAPHVEAVSGCFKNFAIVLDHHVGAKEIVNGGQQIVVAPHELEETRG